MRVLSFRPLRAAPQKFALRGVHRDPPIAYLSIWEIGSEYIMFAQQSVLSVHVNDQDELVPSGPDSTHLEDAR